MLNENLEKTIEIQTEKTLRDFNNFVEIYEKKFLKEKYFFSLYLVFSILSSFILGVMVDRFILIEEGKSDFYYSEVK